MTILLFEYSVLRQFSLDVLNNFTLHANVVKKTYFLSGVLIFYCSVRVADETFF